MDAAAANSIKDHAENFRRLGATGVFLFGSRARNDYRPESDIDLFIDYDREKLVPNLFELVGLELDLGEKLGFPVYITTRDSLHPLMKDKILGYAIQLI
jgi:uncharacterized protein